MDLIWFVWLVKAHTHTHTHTRTHRELDLSLQSGAAAEGPSVEEVRQSINRPIILHTSGLFTIPTFPTHTLPHQLNHAIHAALILREGVPPHFSHARVEHGVLRLEDWHQFALSLTLESAADPATAPWRLLDLQFLLPRVRAYVQQWRRPVPCLWYACAEHTHHPSSCKKINTALRRQERGRAATAAAAVSRPRAGRATAAAGF